MKRIAVAAFLLVCFVLHARPALADAPKLVTVPFQISTDRQSLMLNGTLHTLPSKPAEAFYKVRNGGVAALYLSPDGSPGAVDVGNSFMVADSFGCGFQCMTYDANNNLDVNIVAGTVTFSGSIPAGTNTIGGVTLIANAASNNMVRTQLDFSTGNTGANCQPATVYDGSTAPNILSLTECYIIKSGAGVLYGVEWNSLSNMTTITAGVSVTCFDKATVGAGTGNNIVWQGQLGAGQYANLPPYGVPFKIGLECQSSSAIASSSVSFFETWTK